MISAEELIYNVRLGRREALELLFFVYEKKMRQVVKKYEYLFDRIGYSNEDIKSIIYKSLLHSLKHYSPTSGEFYSFSKVVLVRNIICVFREHASSYELNSFNVSKNYDDYYSLEESVVDESIDTLDDSNTQLMYELVSKLEPLEKKILNLYMSGYSYVEISEICNLKVKKISNTIQRARQKLRKELLDNQ